MLVLERSYSFTLVVVHLRATQLTRTPDLLQAVSLLLLIPSTASATTSDTSTHQVVAQPTPHPYSHRQRRRPRSKQTSKFSFGYTKPRQGRPCVAVVYVRPPNFDFHSNAIKQCLAPTAPPFDRTQRRPTRGASFS